MKKPTIKNESEKPILFSAGMIRRVIRGEKSQTRRVITVPKKHGEILDLFDDYYLESHGVIGVDTMEAHNVPLKCPYGKVGTKLWVRETWADADIFYNNGGLEDPETIAYRADGTAIQFGGKTHLVGAIDQSSWNWDIIKWKPSIFMKRYMSRLTLEITDLRVERVQDISPEDCIAEGIASPEIDQSIGSSHVRVVFGFLWNEINETRGAGWHKNPWVWCVSFRIVKNLTVKL